MKLSLYHSSNIIPLPKAALMVNQFKKQGKRVGLCHGGFDLLHPGQVKHFESAKKACDILFVSVTSDRFTTERKGSGRPIFTDTLRAYMIANLRMVDYVVITDFKLGVDVIRALKPTYYIKGPDFIGKQTLGITAEREAIRAVGGSMVYTNDPKLSTTEIIDTIKKTHVLICVDRDGTLITNDGFVGRERGWKKKIRLNEPVIHFLSFLQTKYKTTTIVVSNQSGVARGYFSEKRVKDVNTKVKLLLGHRNISVDSWQYCPDVTRVYARAHPEVEWQSRYVTSVSRRKPSKRMAIDALRLMGKSLEDFNERIVIGNHDDDAGLAVNLNASFIDVRQ